MGGLSENPLPLRKRSHKRNTTNVSWGLRIIPKAPTAYDNVSTILVRRETTPFQA